MNRQRLILYRRRGAAFLMVVVLVVLVVLGAIKTLVTGEHATRRGEIQRLRSKTLLAALETTVASGLATEGPIRLPIDPAAGQWVEVTRKDDQLTARWMVGERVLDEMVREEEPLVRELTPNTNSPP